MNMKEAKERISSLEKELDDAKQSAKSSADKWVESEREKASGLGDKLELGRLQKQLRIIGHITAGRGNEAIQEILTPLPVSFELKVVFADDKTRIAAEDELLRRLKKTIIQSVESVVVERG